MAACLRLDGRQQPLLPGRIAAERRNRGRANRQRLLVVRHEGCEEVVGLRICQEAQHPDYLGPFGRIGIGNRLGQQLVLTEFEQ